jgi:hypothetical protein
MTLIADILLAAGAFGAAVYCSILSARLKTFSTLETGMGGAIAVLSAQVDDMTRALETARGASDGSAGRLADLAQRAETASARLELLVASLHDLGDAPGPSVMTEADPDPTDAARRMRFVRQRVARDRVEAAE